MRNATVSVATGEPDRLARLLSVLGEWLDIDIQTRDLRDRSPADAEVVFCRTSAEVHSLPPGPARERLVLFRGEPRSPYGSCIRFSQSPRVPPVLRGQQLDQQLETTLLEMCAGDILAEVDGVPVWAHCQQTDFAAEALPALQPRELLCEYLHSRRWTGLLPLIAFLRRVTSERQWVSPPLRACIMIDDPNLHWPSYGFINYRLLAQHAKAHGYHVAIATIPFDAWLIHPGVAALFRANTQHLSLLVHGNNHTRHELARTYLDRNREGLVAQSLKRIARLEHAAKLRIPKIMAAPHSACTEEIAGELLRQGYEAACISHELVRRFNPGRAWPTTFGLESAEFLSGGLPVIPRFPLWGKSLNAALMAAFLDQPIVPFGHHENMADGAKLVNKVAGQIDAMGPVKWCNLAEIARTNYKYRISSRTLQLRMYSRRIEARVPADIDTVEVHRPWLDDRAPAEPLQMRIDGGEWVQLKDGHIRLKPPHNGGPRAVQIRSIWAEPLDYRRIASQPIHAWGIARRFLTATRDRCYGLVKILPW